MQLGDRALTGTLGGIDAALEEGEGVAAAVEDVAEGRVLVDGVGAGLFGFGDLVFPELGFDAIEAAELPIGADEGIDQQAGERGGRLKLVEVFGGEGFELGGVFAPNDLGLGMNAGFERIAAGGGLALDGARTGGTLCVAAIGLDLTEGGHIRSFD